MADSADLVYLRHVLDLCKSGSRLPQGAMEALIAAPPAVEPFLIDLARAPAVRDDSWGPLWALLVLGERRSPAGLDAILEAMLRGQDLIHEGVEFALLRYGRAAAGPILAFLDAHPALEGRVHLYSVLARSGDRRALEYLILQLKRDTDCLAGLAWALAEARDPRGLAALEALAARMGRREPEILEALEASGSPGGIDNPLLQDWRIHWTWSDEEESAGEEGEPAAEEPAGWGDSEPETPAFQPRCYDVDCPACGSHLEYDTSDGSVRMVRDGRVQASRRGNHRR